MCESSLSTDATGNASADASAEVRAALEVLVEVDLGVCGFRELDVVRGAAQRVRGFLASVDMRVARRNDELLQSWGAGTGTGADSASDQVTGDGAAEGSGGADGAAGPCGLPRDDAAQSFGGTTDRRSDAEVARDRGRSQVCSAMPAFEEALAEGRIGEAHLDSVVAAFGRIDVDEVRRAFVERADELVGYATVERAERFRRRCNDMVLQLLRAHGIELSARQRRAANTRSWWDRRSGMWHLHLEVEPELGAKLESAIEQRVAARRDQGTDESFQRLRVEAVAELMLASSVLDPRQPELVVLVDWETLRSGVPTEGGMCESVGGGELSPATVRRLACDAGILPVVMGGGGVPLDVGRKERVATTAQRRALRAMYRTCAHPGCTRPFSWTRMHHVVWWELGGLTNLELLLPLCDEHHHLVHEGGWTLTMTPDRVCTWRTPSGQVWFEGDTRDGHRPETSPSVDSTGRQTDSESENAASESESDSAAVVATGGGAARLDRRRLSVDECHADRLQLHITDAGPSAP